MRLIFFTFKTLMILIVSHSLLSRFLDPQNPYSCLATMEYLAPLMLRFAAEIQLLRLTWSNWRGIMTLGVHTGLFNEGGAGKSVSF